MKCLLDTHILLWALTDDRRLKEEHKTLIEDLNNEIYLSFYSLMEISIKSALGKLPEFGKINILREIEEAKIVLLPCDVTHLNEYSSLPLFNVHRDPFDKFIIACAKANDLPILSYDKNFQLYQNVLSVF